MLSSFVLSPASGRELERGAFAGRGEQSEGPRRGERACGVLTHPCTLPGTRFAVNSSSILSRKSSGVRPRSRWLSLHGQRKSLKKRRPDTPSLSRRGRCAAAGTRRGYSLRARDALCCSSGQAAAQLAMAWRTRRTPLRNSNSVGSANLRVI